MFSLFTTVAALTEKSIFYMLHVQGLGEHYITFSSAANIKIMPAIDGHLLNTDHFKKLCELCTD